MLPRDVHDELASALSYPPRCKTLVESLSGLEGITVTIVMELGRARSFGAEFWDKTPKEFLFVVRRLKNGIAELESEPSLQRMLRDEFRERVRQQVEAAECSETKTTAVQEELAETAVSDATRLRVQALVPTAIAALYTVADLMRVRYYFPDAIESGEARRLHDSLVDVLEGVICGEGFEFITPEYKRPSFDAPHEHESVRLLGGGLVLIHSNIAVPFDKAKLPELVKVTIESCLLNATGDLRDAIARVIDAKTWDCRIPTPRDDMQFQSAGRAVFLLREYWQRIKRLLLIQAEQLAGWQPHPLLRWISNLNLRIEWCFEKLKTIDGAVAASDTFCPLIEILSSGSGDELQMVEEWTAEQILLVDRFIETARLTLGGNPRPLIAEESGFLGAVDKLIGEHEASIERIGAKLLKQVAPVDHKTATKGADGETAGSNGAGSSPSPPTPPALSAKKLKAFEFIKERGPVKAILVANHIGIGESTFRTHYLPALRDHGVRHDGDGYIVDKPVPRAI